MVRLILARVRPRRSSRARKCVARAVNKPLRETIPTFTSLPTHPSTPPTDAEPNTELNGFSNTNGFSDADLVNHHDAFAVAEQDPECHGFCNADR